MKLSTSAWGWGSAVGGALRCSAPICGLSHRKAAWAGLKQED